MFKSEIMIAIVLWLVMTSLASNALSRIIIHDYNNYSISVGEQYSTLLDILGRKLFLIKLYPVSAEATINTVSIFCENTLVNLAIRTMNLEDYRDFEDMLGKVADYKQRYIEEYGVWYRYVEYEKASVVYTSLGYMYYTYGNGRVEALHILGANFSDILLEKILNLRLYGVNYSVVYGGISDRVVWTENGSVITQGESPYTVYGEPFEKFYITIHGVRIAYPLKIGVEATEQGRILKYFEGFLPHGLIDKEITVDSKVLNMVMDEYSKATGIKIKSPDELVVLDIYYAITPDRVYLAPMIIVTKNNTNRVALIALYGDKVRTIHIMVLAGEYYPSELGINLLEAILEDSNKPRIEHYTIVRFLLIVLIVIPIVVLSYIVFRKVRV